MTHDEIAVYLDGIEKLEWSEQWNRVLSLCNGPMLYKEHCNAPAIQKWINSNAAAISAYSSPENALRAHRIAHLPRLFRVVYHIYDDMKLRHARKRYERIRAARKQRGVKVRD